jgi:hypothetical protein
VQEPAARHLLVHRLRRRLRERPPAVAAALRRRRRREGEEAGAAAAHAVDRHLPAGGWPHPTIADPEALRTKFSKLAALG